MLSKNSDKEMAKQKQLSPKNQVWIDARKRHKLSHAHIQMARELGMNPKKFGKFDNLKQEHWKAPLPIFIEDLYFKRFGKDRPENVRSIEQMVKDKKRRQIEQKQRKLKEKEKSQQDAGEGPGNIVPF
jgi:rhodanese-related sulfurtransferase